MKALGNRVKRGALNVFSATALAMSGCFSRGESAIQSNNDSEEFSDEKPLMRNLREFSVRETTRIL